MQPNIDINKNSIQSIIFQAKSYAKPDSESDQILTKMEDLKVKAMEKAATTLSKSLNESTKKSKSFMVNAKN